MARTKKTASSRKKTASPATPQLSPSATTSASEIRGWIADGLTIFVALIGLAATLPTIGPGLTVFHKGDFPWTQFSPGSSPRFKVSYDSEQLTSPFNVCLNLKNTGTSPISKEDVRESLFLPIGGAEVISSGIKSSKPDDVASSTQTRTAANGCWVDFDLLNPGDTVHFDLLTDGPPLSVGPPRARIKGIGSIRMVESPIRVYPERPNFSTWVFKSLVLSAAFILSLWGLSAPIRTSILIFRTKKSEFTIWGRKVRKLTWSAASLGVAVAIALAGWFLLGRVYDKEMRELGAVGVTDIHDEH